MGIGKQDKGRGERVRPRRQATSARVPDGLCPVCRTRMAERLATLSMPVNGETVRVARASHLACPDCGEVVLRRDEARFLRERALAAYRKKHGLLDREEILSIRLRLSMTQAEFARLLRLGSSTVSRWESGRKVQSASLDLLLRLIRDVPESIAYVQSLAA